MLLALFSDFWTLPWPGGATPSPTPVPSPTNAGSGKMRDYPQVEAWPDRARDDYWDAREAFLIRNRSVEVPEVARHIPEVVKKVDKHNRILELAARFHVTGARLINLDSMLNDIRNAVAKMEQDAEDEAIEILLLM
jgi:hypothetical protein